MAADEFVKALAGGDQIPSFVAQNLLFRSVKASAMATRQPSEFQGYAIKDLEGPAFTGDGYATKAFVPGQFVKDPELFWGPFMQLGSFLKGKGVIESDGLAMAMDIVLDPTNLIGAGTLGSLSKMAWFTTKEMRVARALSVLSHGVVDGVSGAGAITDAGLVVDRGLDLIETAFRVGHHQEALFAAAKSGDAGAIKSILDGALKSGRLSDDEARMMAALRKDRNGLAHILKHAEDLRGKRLQPWDIAQPDVPSALRAGQVRHLAGVAIPKNPLKHPLAFARQMVGFSRHDEYWFPAADLTAGVMDKLTLGGKLLDVPEWMRPIKGMRVSEVISAENEALAGVKAFAGNRLPVASAAYGMQALRVLAGSPNDKIAATLVEEALPVGYLEKMYRSLPGNSATGKIDQDDFELFKENLLARMNAARAKSDSALMHQQSSLLKSAEEALSGGDPMLQFVLQGEMDKAAAEAMSAQLRKLQAEFRIKALAMDQNSPSAGLHARGALTNLMARLTGLNIRHVLHGSYKNRSVRGFVDEALRSVVEHPGLWKLDEKTFRYHLVATPEEIASSGASFLEDLLVRSRGGKKSAGLEAMLRTEGLTPEVSYIAKEMADTVASVGENIFHNERIVKGLWRDYFPRVFIPNEKYYKSMQGSSDLAAGIRSVFSQDAEREVFERLTGETFERAYAKANSPTATMAKTRRLTEQVALSLEKLGMGEYVKSSTILYTSYMAAAGNAVLFNRLFRDMPHISGYLTRSAVVALKGEKVSATISDKVLSGLRRVMIAADDEMPQSAKQIMRPIEGPAAALDPFDDVEYLGDLAMAKLMESEWYRDRVVKAVGAEIDTAAKAADAAERGFYREAGKMMDDADATVRQLRAKVDNLNRALDAMTKDAVGAGVKKIEAAEKALDGVYDDLSKQVAKLEKRLLELDSMARQVELDTEELARQRVASELTGKSSISMKDSAGRVHRVKLTIDGKPVQIQEDWVLLGSVPERLEGKMRVKGAIKSEVERVRAEMVEKVLGERIDKARGVVKRRLAEMREAVDAQARRLDAAYERAGPRVLSGERRVAAAGRSGEAGVRNVERLRRLVSRKELLDIEERMTRKVSGLFSEAERRAELAAKIRGSARDSIRGRMARLRKEAADRVLGREEAALKPKRKKVWVFESDYAPLQEMFRLYERNNTRKAFELYDLWNYRLKSLVLLGDIFHFNVLATSQMLAAPERFFKMLVDDAGKLLPGAENGMRRFAPSNVAVASAIGTAGGAVVGGLRDGDGEQMAGWSFAGALYGMTVGGAMKNAKYALNTAFQPEHLETLMHMGYGGWSGRPDDRAIGYLNRTLATMRDKVARDPTTRFLVDPIEKTKHLVDWWDEQLWEVLHNGSKHYYFSVAWERGLKRLTDSREWSDAGLLAEFAAKKGIKPVVADGAAPASADGKSAQLMVSDGGWWRTGPGRAGNILYAKEAYDALAGLGLSVRIGHVRGQEAFLTVPAHELLKVGNPAEVTRLVGEAIDRDIQGSSFWSLLSEVRAANPMAAAEVEKALRDGLAKAADDAAGVLAGLGDSLGLSFRVGIDLDGSRIGGYAYTSEPLRATVSISQDVDAIVVGALAGFDDMYAAARPGQSLSDALAKRVSRMKPGELEQRFRIAATRDLLGAAGHESVHAILSSVDGGVEGLRIAVASVIGRDADSVAAALKNGLSRWRAYGALATERLAELERAGGIPSGPLRELKEDLARAMSGERITKTSQLARSLLGLFDKTPPARLAPDAGFDALRVAKTPEEVSNAVAQLIFEELLADGGARAVLEPEFLAGIERTARETGGVYSRVLAVISKVIEQIELIFRSLAGGSPTAAPSLLHDIPDGAAGVVEDVAAGLFKARKERFDGLVAALERRGVVSGQSARAQAVGIEIRSIDARARGLPGESLSVLDGSGNVGLPQSADVTSVRLGRNAERAVSAAFKSAGWVTGPVDVARHGKLSSKGGGVKMERGVLSVDWESLDVLEVIDALRARGGDPGARVADVLEWLDGAASDMRAKLMKTAKAAGYEYIPVGEATPSSGLVFAPGVRAPPKKPATSGPGPRVKDAAPVGDVTGDAARGGADIQVGGDVYVGGKTKSADPLIMAMADDPHLREHYANAAARLGPDHLTAWTYLAPAEVGGRGMSYGEAGRALGVPRLTMERRYKEVRAAGRSSAWEAMVDAVLRDERYADQVEKLVSRGYSEADALKVTRGRVISDLYVINRGATHSTPRFMPGGDGGRPRLPAGVEGGDEFRKFAKERRREMKQQLARELVGMSNNIFGGQTWFHLLNNPQFQTIARRFLLSPDWTYSRLALTKDIFLNMSAAQSAGVGAVVGQMVELAEAGGDPEQAFSGRGVAFGAAGAAALSKWAAGTKRRMMVPGNAMRREARRISAAALFGGYVFANVLNKAFTGKWMFENDEGRRTQVGIGGGEYVAMGKPWVEAFEFAGVYHPDKYPLPVVSRFVSKGAALPVTGLRVAANRNYFGGAVFSGEDSPMEVSGKVFETVVDAGTPIMFQGPLRYAGNLLFSEEPQGPKDLANALMRSAGFNIQTPRRGLNISAMEAIMAGSRPAIRDYPSLSEGL